MNNLVLGIDVGGTHIKSGLVSPNGEVSEQKTSSTSEWIASGDFVGCLKSLVKSYECHRIVGCGIAVPGTLNRDEEILFMPAIPSLEGLCLKKILKKEYPHLHIAVENDANAAAFGEYKLHTEKIRNGMFLVTLGTGVGCGLILNEVIFKGGNGNALELGEILTEKNERLEDLIGVNGIEKMAKANNTQTHLSVPDVIRLANANDACAVEIMHHVGQTLGRAIVHTIWLFDVYNIILGGGVATAFASIKEGIDSVLDQVLPPDIRKRMKIEKAVLANNAGLVGIALCCFNEIEIKN